MAAVVQAANRLGWLQRVRDHASTSTVLGSVLLLLIVACQAIRQEGRPALYVLLEVPTYGRVCIPAKQIGPVITSSGAAEAITLDEYASLHAGIGGYYQAMIGAPVFDGAKGQIGIVKGGVGCSAPVTLFLAEMEDAASAVLGCLHAGGCSHCFGSCGAQNSTIEGGGNLRIGSVVSLYRSLGDRNGAPITGTIIWTDGYHFVARTAIGRRHPLYGMLGAVVRSRLLAFARHQGDTILVAEPADVVGAVEAWYANDFLFVPRLPNSIRLKLRCNAPAMGPMETSSEIFAGPREWIPVIESTLQGLLVNVDARRSGHATAMLVWDARNVHEISVSASANQLLANQIASSCGALLEQNQSERAPQLIEVQVTID